MLGVASKQKWKPQTSNLQIRWSPIKLISPIYVFLGKPMFFLHLSTFFTFTISWKPGSGSPRKYTLDRSQLAGDFSPASNDWDPSCWAVGTWSSRQGRMAQTSPNSSVSTTVKHQNVFPSWWLGGSVGSESLRDLPKVTEIAKQVSTDANTIKKSNLKQFHPKNHICSIQNTSKPPWILDSHNFHHKNHHFFPKLFQHPPSSIGSRAKNSLPKGCEPIKLRWVACKSVLRHWFLYQKWLISWQKVKFLDHDNYETTWNKWNVINP